MILNKKLLTYEKRYAEERIYPFFKKTTKIFKVFVKKRKAFCLKTKKGMWNLVIPSVVFFRFFLFLNKEKESVLFLNKEGEFMKKKERKMNKTKKKTRFFFSTEKEQEKGSKKILIKIM